jgi:carbonic anhydrase/acetyltransferase-like protein (isoleucine patch superfamily)
MTLYSFEGTSPTVHPTAFVAPTASVIGDVTIEENASVWYGAVLRADFGPIVIRAGANVQDGSVLHSPVDVTTEVGQGATIGHACVVHGCTIGEEALIGNGSTVLDGSSVGARTLVAAGSVVTGAIPADVLAMGTPARVKGPIAGTSAQTWVQLNPQTYRDLAQRHRAGIAEV